MDVSRYSGGPEKRLQISDLRFERLNDAARVARRTELFRTGIITSSPWRGTHLRATCAVMVVLASSMGMAGCGRARLTTTAQDNQAPDRSSDQRDLAYKTAAQRKLASDRSSGYQAERGEADCCEDANANGFPDRAELRSFDDRENFRRWFTWIAEMQFYQMSDAWNPEQRDCAGLVRFAMREALRRHDRAWFQRMEAQQERRSTRQETSPGSNQDLGAALLSTVDAARVPPVAPDVKAYNLETGPLGEKLFRTDYGSFDHDDLSDGKFSEYADGRTLRNYNCTFVGRDRSQARPGDLLFFFQPWTQHYPYHAMIFVGRAHLGDSEGADWVVYHTGSSPSDGGTVKKVRLGVRDHHPDKRWRPSTANRNFDGFYRLKILD